MTNNLKVQGFNNLEKDPDSGAIIMTPQDDVYTIRLVNLSKKVSKLQATVNEILQLLKDDLSKSDA